MEMGSLLLRWENVKRTTTLGGEAETRAITTF